MACSSGDGYFPRCIWETRSFIRKGSIFEISQFFLTYLPSYAVFRIARKEKKISFWFEHKFELNTQCEEWKFLFWVEFEHSFSKFDGHTVIIYIVLRYANSFLWKLEKAANFKSQMEFLLRKHHTFENPISPSAYSIFEVFICIIVMMIFLDHILYCLLHNSTPSSKTQIFTLSVSKDLIQFPLALIWVGKCATIVASRQKVHEGSSMCGLKLPSSSNPLQREVLCQGPSPALCSDSFWLTELKKAVSVTPFWESAKKKQFCSK